MAVAESVSACILAGLLWCPVLGVGGCDGTPAAATDDPPAPPAQPAPQPTTKPAEQTPPAPTPASPKADEPKPASESDAPALPTMKVKLDEKTFNLEMALEDQTRFRGFSGRTNIAADGGMIFIFRNSQPMGFVMRDCPIDIDIVYVDATGRVTAMHHMKAEPPRAENEKVLSPPPGFPNAERWTWTNETYEKRLKKYPSRFDACIAIELKGGTLNIGGDNPGGVSLKVGEKLELNVPELKKKAK